MHRSLKPQALAAPLFVAVVSVYIALSVPSVGDYPGDSEAGINAIRDGHIGTFLSSHPVMGPFSLILRAPFAALGGSGELASYRWGCIPCVLALGCLGLYLGRLAERRGASWLAGLLITGICLLNPLTFEALKNGHAEELLTAALAIGAVAVASQGHSKRAALLLGLALATKQWAIVAVIPTLLVLPTFAASPGTFFDQQTNVAFGNGAVTPWSVWYPTADTEATTVVSGSQQLTLHPHHVSDAVSRWSHPLIVLLALSLPLLLALRRRTLNLSGADAMGILALVCLVRCALDPVDNMYYHLPLLLALVGWDAFESPSLPVRGLLATGVALIFTRWAANLSDPYALSALYLAVAVSAGAAIAFALFRERQPEERWEPATLRSVAGASLPAGS